MESIKVFEAFAGYGSQAMALKRLEIPHEVVGISEIDKYAIQAYNAVHGETPNYGDICTIDWGQVPDFDLFTYSFPCTDISSAGKQKGLSKDGGTRSGLLWECERAIEIKRPKYLLMENVRALVERKFINDFMEWQNLLSRLGYSNYTQILNAKDYGVPQNRERVFMVSILGDGWFNFPEPFKLERCLADVLEPKVDEKYYLSQKMVDLFMKRNTVAQERGNGFKFETRDVSKEAVSITTQAGSRTTDNFIEDSPKILGYTRDSRGKVQSYHEKDIANTLHSSSGGGGNTDQYVIGIDVHPNSKKREFKEFKNTIAPCLLATDFKAPKTVLMGAIRGRNPDNPTSRKSGDPTEQMLELNTSETSNCLTTVQKDNVVCSNKYIRKLTPRECFCLMGVSEEDIDKIQAAGISNSQQYKMAGNSIVVDVLEAIFRQLLSDDREKGNTLFG